MKIIEDIAVSELKKMAEKMFGELVKADVDVRKNLVIVDMPMHYDGEQELLKSGSKQKDIWGVNLRPNNYGTQDFVEFDSMINIKPSLGNSSKDILDDSIRAKILDIINEVVHD